MTRPNAYILMTYGIHSTTFDDLSISFHLDAGTPDVQAWHAILSPTIVKAFLEQTDACRGKEPSKDYMIPMHRVEEQLKWADSPNYESWIWIMGDDKEETTGDYKTDPLPPR